MKFEGQGPSICEAEIKVRHQKADLVLIFVNVGHIHLVFLHTGNVILSRKPFRLWFN